MHDTSMSVRTFSTRAHAPRDPRSLCYPNATLDVVYSVHGQGSGINVVFMHGAQYSRECFSYLIELLRQRMGTKLGKCIAIDHVLAGDSAVLNEGKVASYLVWEDMARDAACVIRDCLRREEITMEEPLVVAGHSMGGAAAMALAVFDPELVAGLVLIDPTWGAEIVVTDREAIHKKMGRMARSAYSRATDKFPDFTSYKEYMHTRSIVAKTDRRVRDAMTNTNYVLHPDGSVSTKASAALQTGPYASALTVFGFNKSLANRIRVPTLLIHGDVYNFNPLGGIQSLEKRLIDGNSPLVKRVEIHGAAHDVCYTHVSDTVNACVPFCHEIEVLFSHKHAEAAEEYRHSVNERFLRFTASSKI